MLKRLWRGLRPLVEQKKGQVLTLLAVSLLVAACNGFMTNIMAKQQRNSHMVTITSEYLDDLTTYRKLPLCTETVTTCCADKAYVVGTIIPAQKAFDDAHAVLNTAVNNGGAVNSVITEAEDSAYDNLKAVSKSDTVQNAIACK